MRGFRARLFVFMVLQMRGVLTCDVACCVGRCPWRRAPLILALLGLAALACGCGNRIVNEDLTALAGGRSVQARQSSPTEIQALVMAFADKYATRAADAFDRVHDQAATIEVRNYARDAKVAAGWGAVTIATEVNPVAAMLDMVTMVRLKRKSFEDHGAALLPPEAAQVIRAMHERSETEVWELAGRFLSEQQMAQLRAVIDDWYAQNSYVRSAAHLKLLDFASFRRETASNNRNAPASVLAMLNIDPLASIDPVQRELAESRMFAERTLFFAKRLPLLASWQLQQATVDMLATPELRDLLARTEKLTASADRLVTSTERFTDACERFAATWEQMPRETDRIVARSFEDLHKVIAAERAAAIEQSAAAIDMQRKALMHDVDALEGSTRNVISDVNKTLVQTQTTASAVSASAKDTVASAQLGAKEVVDQIYRRALTLLVIALIGIPIMLLVYRAAARRLFASRAET